MSTVKDQRIGFPVFELQDAADDDHVIATVMTVLCPALEYRRIAWQNRDARDPFATIQSAKFVGTAHSKPIANIPLVHCEDVDRKMLRLHEGIKGLRFFGDTPKNQGRL